MRRRSVYVKILPFILLFVFFLCPGIPRTGMKARASSVTCKSKYYVTTVVSKNKLKKGKKTRVTVKVKNTSGKDMKNLTVKVTLPARLKKTSGKLSKSKTTLKNGKSWSFSFYVKAKKPVTFKKKVVTTMNVSGSATMITAKNLIKYGVEDRYMRVKASFVQLQEQPVPIEPETPDVTPDVPKPGDDIYAYSLTEPADYGAAMVALLGKMNTYAKKKNASFAMISNGGYNLYAPKAATLKSMLAAVDGVLIEDAFSDDDTYTMKKALSAAIAGGKKAFNIEYDDGKHKYDSASTALGSVCYSSPEDDLSTIPAFTTTTQYNVNTLSDVQNFLALLDPENYSSKKKYFEAINNTDYDLIFIDLFYDDKPLTKAEVNSLKTKKNGGTRKVCAYFSVGEAEKYRYYWQAAWKVGSPEWLCAENPEWKNNYKVKYWNLEWQKLLYGVNAGTDFTKKSYLDNILEAGFDGVYLDVIDAYEYFKK